MKSIIIDDEPLAREGVRRLASLTPEIEITGSFSNTDDASAFLLTNQTDLVFLDIQMPGCSGIEFAKNISPRTLVIFTTAFSDYAVDSYQVDAIDYLLKPLSPERFQKAVDKAISYHAILRSEVTSNIESIAADFMFIKAERKYFKVNFQDILYIEGLKDYVIVHLPDQRIITAMNIKTIYGRIPQSIFYRVSKSYIINLQHIASFDNNSIMIRSVEIPIGTGYRGYFFDEIVSKKLLKR